MIASISNVNFNIPLYEIENNVKMLQSHLNVVNKNSIDYRQLYNHKSTASGETLTTGDQIQAQKLAISQFSNYRAMFKHITKPLSIRISKAKTDIATLRKIANEMSSQKLNLIVFANYNSLNTSDLVNQILIEYPKLVITSPKNLTAIPKFNDLFYDVLNLEVDSYIQTLRSQIVSNGFNIKRMNLLSILSYIRNMNARINKQLYSLNKNFINGPIMCLFNVHSTPASYTQYLLNVNIPLTPDNVIPLFTLVNNEKMKLYSLFSQMNLFAKRRKRNIFSDSLSYITGLATQQQFADLSEKYSQTLQPIKSAIKSINGFDTTLNHLVTEENNLSLEMKRINNVTHGLAHNLFLALKQEGKVEKKLYTTNLLQNYINSGILQVKRLTSEIYSIERLLKNAFELIDAIRFNRMPSCLTKQVIDKNILFMGYIEGKLHILKNSIQIILYIPVHTFTFQVFEIQSLPFITNNVTYKYDIEEQLGVSNLPTFITSSELKQCKPHNGLKICPLLATKTHTCTINLYTAKYMRLPVNTQLCTPFLKLSQSPEQQYINYGNKIALFSPFPDTAVYKCTKATYTKQIHRSVNILDLHKNCHLHTQNFEFSSIRPSIVSLQYDDDLNNQLEILHNELLTNITLPFNDNYTFSSNLSEIQFRSYNQKHIKNMYNRIDDITLQQLDYQSNYVNTTQLVIITISCTVAFLLFACTCIFTSYYLKYRITLCFKIKQLNNRDTTLNAMSHYVQTTPLFTSQQPTPSQGRQIFLQSGQNIDSFIPPSIETVKFDNKTQKIYMDNVYTE